MIDVDVIDAHHHLARVTEVSYPWLEGDPIARYHGDDVPLRRNYLLADYRADMGSLPLVGSVHVENGAADPVAEALWIDGIIRTEGLPSAQVVKVDLASPRASEQLEQHASLATVRGVRDILNWHADPFYSHRDRSDLMADPAWRSAFGRLAGLGLGFDLQVFPGQLAEAARLAAEHPETAIVLDHAGMPIGRGAGSLDEWCRGLRLVAEQPNTVVKISALGTNDHRWSVGSIRGIVLGTIDAFGPGRTMFGSNFPVDGLYSTLHAVYSAFDTITADFAHAERKAMFAGTARDFYRLT